MIIVFVFAFVSTIFVFLFLFLILILFLFVVVVVITDKHTSCLFFLLLSTQADHTNCKRHRRRNSRSLHSRVFTVTANTTKQPSRPQKVNIYTHYSSKVPEPYHLWAFFDQLQLITREVSYKFFVEHIFGIRALTTVRPEGHFHWCYGRA